MKLTNMKEKEKKKREKKLISKEKKKEMLFYSQRKFEIRESKREKGERNNKTRNNSSLITSFPLKKANDSKPQRNSNKGKR